MLKTLQEKHHCQYHYHYVFLASNADISVPLSFQMPTIRLRNTKSLHRHESSLLETTAPHIHSWSGHSYFPDLGDWHTPCCFHSSLETQEESRWTGLCRQVSGAVWRTLNREILLGIREYSLKTHHFDCRYCAACKSLSVQSNDLRHLFDNSAENSNLSPSLLKIHHQPLRKTWNQRVNVYFIRNASLFTHGFQSFFSLSDCVYRHDQLIFLCLFALLLSVSQWKEVSSVQVGMKTIRICVEI